jgi:hypothetical protein
LVPRGHRRSLISEPVPRLRRFFRESRISGAPSTRASRVGIAAVAGATGSRKVHNHELLGESSGAASEARSDLVEASHKISWRGQKRKVVGIE